MIQIHSTQRSLTTIKTIEKRMILNKERSKWIENEKRQWDSVVGEGLNTSIASMSVGGSAIKSQFLPVQHYKSVFS